MCVDLSGGDSELLCSADASGQNCSRIPSQRLGLSQGGAPDGRETSRKRRKWRVIRAVPPQPHAGLLYVCQAQGGLGSPKRRLGEGASPTFCWTPGSSSTGTRLPSENLRGTGRCCGIHNHVDRPDSPQTRCPSRCMSSVRGGIAAPHFWENALSDLAKVVRQSGTPSVQRGACDPGQGLISPDRGAWNGSFPSC